MGKKVTLGGDRVGSGNRMKQELHNYFRSNHNLSCARITSAAPGVLYPLYTNIGLTGDTFDIDLNAFVRTLPTEGPMFGAFKLQADVYTADLRLYQAILHNNTTEIGMDMDKVLLPKIQLSTYARFITDETTKLKKWEQQFSKSSLMYYLGVSGIGRPLDKTEGQVTRKFNATPLLAYYDIFKNYYSNKQEENAYVINNESIAPIYNGIVPNVTKAYKCSTGSYNNETCVQVDVSIIDVSAFQKTITIGLGEENLFETGQTIILFGENFNYYNEEGRKVPLMPNQIDERFVRVECRDNMAVYEWFGEATDFPDLEFTINGNDSYQPLEERKGITLSSFPLKNIDKMRKNLLTYWDLGEEFVITDDYTELPYRAITQTEEGSGDSVNKSNMQGLVVKCYQSDMFNNWLETEWVNKITQRSKVNVSNGSFSMDALNLAKKIYEHYNRVAINGGSYDDWQLAAYGEENYGKPEKPVYHGGMSAEVIFDEVVSSVANADQPLGTLGGRGTLKGNRGGHVIIKCREACVIMIIVSLTPRVTYSQGNSWFMTELDSIDDLHKPQFDRIGFQDLLIEKMAWWDTQVDENGVLHRQSAGKQPAWIDYMTDVDKCYADFAQEDGKGYMVLQRQYTPDQTSMGVADVTTYIDPTQYNYPFAVRSIDAQNFWIFMNLDIKARRKMSAKQIPNV